MTPAYPLLEVTPAPSLSAGVTADPCPVPVDQSPPPVATHIFGSSASPRAPSPRG